MSGMFDADEWEFERKRDERTFDEVQKAAKEKEIRDNWIEWGNKRLMKGDSAAAISHNEQIAAFVDAQIKTEIAKL